MEKTLLDEFKEYMDIKQQSETITSDSLIILPLLQYEKINENTDIKKIDSILDSEKIKKLKFYKFEDYFKVSDKIDLYLSEFSDEIINLLPESIDKQGISFLLYELLINIYKHSKFKNSYVQVNVSQDKRQINMCIIDDGIGIPGSFDEGLIYYNNDCEAIYESINGKTTDKEKYNLHGRGLNTSVRLTTLGFNSEILISSRNGICDITAEGARLYKNNRYINGTFIMLRINNKRIEDIYDCIKHEKINKLEVVKND